MKITRPSAREVLIGFSLLMAVSASLALAAWIFAVSARWWAGVQISELDLASYSTPTPEPAGNFFSSLGFDFDHPVDGSYRARQVMNLPLQPQLKGQIDRSSPEAIPWPFDPVLAHAVDLEASAKAIRQLAEEGVTSSAKDGPAYPRSLLEAKNARELCSLFLQPVRPYLQNIYASLPEPKSIYPAPPLLQASLDTPTLKFFDLLSICQLLALDQLLDFGSSDHYASAKPLLAALRIAEGLFERPVGFFAFLGGTATCTLSLPLLWQGVDGGHFSDSAILGLLRQLERLDPMQNTKKVISQESAWRFQFMEWFAWKEPWWKRVFLIPISQVWQGFFILHSAEIQRELKRDTVFKNHPSAPLPAFWNAYAVFYPKHAIDLHNEARHLEIMLRLARQDLALNLFIRKNSQAPERLEALVPSILPSLPKDPFTGNNFGYRKTSATSYLLYSCWVDAKDDGGTSVTIPQPPPKDLMLFLRHQAKGDLVWPQHHVGKN